MNYKAIVKKLQEFAPLKLAEKWDNVGLLIEPYTPKEINKILLTNDLTEDVLEEAINSNINFILSYHPPIFSPLKRLNVQNVKERIVIRAIEEKIAIYSPHTAFDSVKGGINDWLAEGLGEGNVSVIQSYSEHAELKLVVFVPKENVDTLRSALSDVGVGVIGNYSQCSFNIEGVGTFFGNESSNPVIGTKSKYETVSEIRLEMVFNRSKMQKVIEVIKKVHPYETPAWDVYQLEAMPVEGTGQGRLVTLNNRITLAELVERVKKHLRLPHVRLATGSSTKSKEELQIKTIALCAGAGDQVISKTKADVYLTGEMRHHDVLAAVEKGTSVILTEHSNSERGYLLNLKGKLQQLFEEKIDIEISKKDADPLVIV